MNATPKTITPSMRTVLERVQEHGAQTAAQLAIVTGYANGTVQNAIYGLRQLGKLAPIGKQNRGLGNGQGRSSYLYGATDR